MNNYEKAYDSWGFDYNKPDLDAEVVVKHYEKKVNRRLSLDERKQIKKEITTVYKLLGDRINELEVSHNEKFELAIINLRSQRTILGILRSHNNQQISLLKSRRW